MNAAKIGCARVFNTRDQYEDAHYAAREMTVPVLDRQSGVPIRVYGVVPKMSLTPGRILSDRIFNRKLPDYMTAIPIDIRFLQRLNAKCGQSSA